MLHEQVFKLRKRLLRKGTTAHVLTFSWNTMTPGRLLVPVDSYQSPSPAFVLQVLGFYAQWREVSTKVL